MVKNCFKVGLVLDLCTCDGLLHRSTHLTYPMVTICKFVNIASFISLSSHTNTCTLFL